MPRGEDPCESAGFLCEIQLGLRVCRETYNIWQHGLEMDSELVGATRPVTTSAVKVFSPTMLAVANCSSAIRLEVDNNEGNHRKSLLGY